MRMKPPMQEPRTLDSRQPHPVPRETAHQAKDDKSGRKLSRLDVESNRRRLGGQGEKPYLGQPYFDKPGKER